jgi:cytochrome c peroxidase
MCHIPEQGFTNNELARPIGFEGRAIKRNAPTILNIAFARSLFVDGREDRLEQQVWAPLLASNEMNNASVGAVVNQLKQDAQYRTLFAQAFDQAPNMLNIGLALAQYEQSLIAADSDFDRWYFGQQKQLFNAQQRRGFALFTGKAQCNRCHLIGETSALFTDHGLHNTGVGYADSMLDPDSVTVQLAPGLTTELDVSVLQSVGEEKENDLGRYEVTLDPADRWKFRTPSLRNVAITAPYMHNGQFQTLHKVVQFYNQGGVKHEQLSPLIRPLNLSAAEVDAVVAFMQTLTGSNVSELVADAFAVEVGDPIDEDAF